LEAGTQNTQKGVQLIVENAEHMETGCMFLVSCAIPETRKKERVSREGRQEMDLRRKELRRKKERKPMIEQIKNDTMTAESIQAFRRFLENEEKSPHTVQQYMHDVGAFFKFLPEDKKLGKEAVIQYKAELLERYGKPVTVNTKLCAVNKYLAFMNLYHYQVKSIKVQRSMFRDAGRELTRAEYIRLLNAAKKKKDLRLFLIMETICATGIRVSELRYVTVQGVLHNHVEVTAKGKTRQIFLPKKLRTELLRYIKEKGQKMVQYLSPEPGTRWTDQISGMR